MDQLLQRIQKLEDERRRADESNRASKESQRILEQDVAQSEYSNDTKCPFNYCFMKYWLGCRYIHV